MSMTLPVDAAMSRLGGALDFVGAMAPQMPDFGAMPDAAAVESANAAAQSERMRKEQARQEAAQRRYRELVESGVIDENGLSKDGKMYRGPKARLFVAQNGGRDFVLKDKDKAAQLNRITIAENRELGGLDPLPEDTSPASTTVLPETDDDKAELLRHVAMTGQYPDGRKAPSEIVQIAGAQVFPEGSKRAADLEKAERAREKARQAKLKAMQLDFQFLPAAFDALKQSERIINEKGSLAAGSYAGAIPEFLNQARVDLKNYLNSIGAEELKKNVEALRSTSENGTLGMRLTQEEIMKEIQRAGPLTVDTSPETLLRTIKNLRKRLSHEVSLAARQLKSFDPKAYENMGEWLQQGDPEIFKLYQDAVNESGGPKAGKQSDISSLSDDELLRQLGGV